jgi:hypothetical protein
MKKLVAIALIAAMATVANAGVSFVASGVDKDLVAPGLQLDAGDAVTISMVVSGGTSAGFDVGVIDDGDALGAASDLSVNPLLTTQTNPGYVENSDAKDGSIGALISFWGYVTSGTPLAAGATLASFQYTIAATQVGDVTIACAPAGSYWSALDGAAYEFGASTAGFGSGVVPIDAVTLNVIPEPMTLGLLGLGGLFLRRRLA